MKFLCPSLLLAAGALALAGCGGEKKATSAQAGDGQILARSVSDDMLPYDTVRSQPPYAAPDASEGTDGADAAVTIGGPAASASEAADAGDAAVSEPAPPANQLAPQP
ncbi:hypothetical protein [Novosphingobium album (ex Liu et al. 2023)]|uniref:DUF3035 domain-containing protein n=1 Tax=Novosphingobium album (ex Liu et al. 2023) TaxID=3031130 RepID=A0ABT5WRC5_9SPHN|nr:hypothetical protein [Novosphingobium album (ex Liu et al. 2023)]MDE8652394.1 hypothetical protein [Novosphingobium album (ex Liu et al. 2023)]